MIEYFVRMISHLRWADERVLRSLHAAGEPPARALELYAHILGAEHVWLARLKGEQPRYPVWPSLTLDECADLSRRSGEGLLAFVSSLSVPALSLEIAYTNSAGVTFRSRTDDVVTQVVTHGCYHRGQVAWLLRQAGHEPQPTDYIAFVRGAPAATRQT